MEEEEDNIQEKNLIKQLTSKINEYFTKNKTLKKTALKEFISFINFPNLPYDNNDGLELFWQEISKNSKNDNLTKELLIKNLLEYIDNHNEEIFQSQYSLLERFLQRPVKLIEDIDDDNELLLELYRLLATIDFNGRKNIPLLNVENALNEYKFINLTKEDLNDLLKELLQEKNDIESIKINYFLEIMEEMSKAFNEYILEKNAQREINFSEKDLEKPELKDFIDLETFVKILLKISDSVSDCHKKSFEDIKHSNDLNRHFYILINNMRLYFYEILRIYKEQNQKFAHFIHMNDSKITILKQQKKD